MRLDAFFNYARLRYQIMLDRHSGKPWPWTDDPVLNRYRFCNVFREHDKTTRWFKAYIRERLRYETDLVFQAVVVFRWFARISTGRALLPLFDDEITYDKLLGTLRSIDGPICTGSYMVVSPPGYDKAEGLTRVIMNLLDNWDWSFFSKGADRDATGPQRTLEETWLELKKFYYCGEFTAYEIVTCLRHTCILEEAPDIMTWASPGPGCSRGVSRLLYNEIGHVWYTKKDGYGLCLEVMRDIVEASQDPQYWPAEWPKWEMRDAEHTLCEFDKYERVSRGEGQMKNTFRPPGKG